MTRSSAIGIAAAALLSASAIAQTTSNPAAPMPAPATTTMPTSDTKAMHGGSVMASKIIGATVYAPKDGASITFAPMSGGTVTTTSTTVPATDTTVSVITYRPVSKADWGKMKDQLSSIGEIEDLAVGADGKIHHAIVGIGGFLGIGERDVMIDPREISFMRDEDGSLYFVIMKTCGALESLPKYEPAKRS